MSMVGLLTLSPDNVDWRMRLHSWLHQRPTRAETELLKALCEHYLEDVITHVTDRTRQSVHRLDAPPVTVKSRTKNNMVPVKELPAPYERYMDQSADSMVITLTCLLEVSCAF